MSPHKGSLLFISENSEGDSAKFNNIRSLGGRHFIKKIWVGALYKLEAEVSNQGRVKEKESCSQMKPISYLRFRL